MNMTNRKELWQRLCLAVGILAAGSLFALPFRHGTSEEPEAPNETPHEDNISYRSVAPPLEMTQSRPPSVGVYDEEGMAQRRAAETDPDFVVPTIQEDTLRPAMADQYNPIGRVRPRHREREREMERIPFRDEQPLRMHIVRDGDSLPLLAQRFLGDRRYAQDIFDVNRDKLESPDLLPLGIELRIPVVSRD